MHHDSSSEKVAASATHPQRNWPLILTVAGVGLVTAVIVLGSVALWVTNFNLLEWME